MKMTRVIESLVLMSVSLGIGCAQSTQDPVSNPGTPAQQSTVGGGNPNAMSNTPAPLQPVTLAVGFQHACAIREDHTLVCWGSDTFGRTQIPADLGRVVSVSASYSDTCAIKEDRTVACWGWLASHYPVPTDLGRVVSVSVGHTIACVIREDRSVACWGHNASFQAPGLQQVSSLSVSGDTACAVQAIDHSLHCWGGDMIPFIQSRVPHVLFDRVSISEQRHHYSICGVTLDNAAHCWGDSRIARASAHRHSLVQSTVTGFGYACSILADGMVNCQAGPSIDNHTTVPADLGPVRAIAAGGATCAIKRRDHTVRCWGESATYHPTDITDVPADLGRVLVP